MGDLEKALAARDQRQRVRAAVFAELRERGPSSCPELIEILRPIVGEPYEHPWYGTRLALGYSDVWLALKELEREGAVTSERIYNARIWTARG